MNDNNNTPENNEEDVRTPFEEFLYHQRRALEETGKALEALLPEGFRTHSNEATKEFTKGFRVLVDAAMDEIKKASQKSDSGSNDDDTSTTGRTKVKVQVD
ncbi:MAG TPA: hypothetical protein VHL11_20435 [Phototrophicaceae bacterium]|jgi:hypothetical protein|nr:hypothetical protein [Phototrophicaceae bacterium]